MALIRVMIVSSGVEMAAGLLAGVSGPTACPNVQDALSTGQFTLAPHPAQDFVLGGTHLVIAPPSDGCP